jgi:membrane protease YdiL (CAAX protease family)
MDSQQPFATPDFTTAEPQSSEPAPPPAPIQPSLLRRIFIGSFGLRAGWSLLIYIALIFGCVKTINFIHNKVTHKTPVTQSAPAAATKAPAPPPAAKPDPSKPAPMRGMIIQEGVVFAAILFLSWIMSLIERRRLAVYGLGGRNVLGRFLTGTLWGLIGMGLLIASLRIFHLLSFDGRLDFGAAIFGWGALQLIGFLLVGLFEEYLFRGYLQFTLTRGMAGLGKTISPEHGRSIAFWIAAVLTSALFYFAHTGNSGETPVGLVIVFLAGIVLVLALWKTGSLWWAIGFHMAWDWSQSFLYGVPDSGGLMQGRLFATHAMGKPLLSGGTDGPEGSLLCIPVLLLLIVVLLFFTRSSPQPPLEPKMLPSDNAYEIPASTISLETT